MIRSMASGLASLAPVAGTPPGGVDLAAMVGIGSDGTPSPSGLDRFGAEQIDCRDSSGGGQAGHRSVLANG